MLDDRRVGPHDCLNFGPCWRAVAAERCRRAACEGTGVSASVHRRGVLARGRPGRCPDGSWGDAGVLLRMGARKRATWSAARAAVLWAFPCTGFARARTRALRLRVAFSLRQND